ncbi:XLF-domain-containing protein, partial [Piedraia hortae CBS 480.64]
MADRWRSLCLDQTNVPQLFIRTNIAATGYTIHITDLSRVWGETIREPDIKSRARSSRCSIDPSDGEDQYKILLQKLQEAANQERGTSIALHPGAIDDLILTLTAPLPDPLPDFEWEASLSSLPSHCVKDLVIAPLLAHVSVLQCQIPTLIREIQEKDRVISRLVDRLEQSGNGLVHVFLNVATTQNGSKNMQREQVARYVRGLSPFDEAEWKEKQDSILPSPTPGDKAVCGVLESLRPAIIHTEHAAKSDNWWQNLGNRATHTGGLHREHSASWGSLSKTTASADGSKKEDDGFQRQPTPPHLKKRA